MAQILVSWQVQNIYSHFIVADGSSVMASVEVDVYDAVWSQCRPSKKIIEPVGGVLSGRDDTSELTVGLIAVAGSGDETELEGAAICLSLTGDAYLPRISEASRFLYWVGAFI